MLLRLRQETRDAVDDEHLGWGVVRGGGEGGAVRRRGVAGEQRVEGGVVLRKKLREVERGVGVVLVEGVAYGELALFFICLFRRREGGHTDDTGGAAVEAAAREVDVLDGRAGGGFHDLYVLGGGAGVGRDKVDVLCQRVRVLGDGARVDICHGKGYGGCVGVELPAQVRCGTEAMILGRRVVDGVDGR